MPKKIDYVIVAPAHSGQEDGADGAPAEEESTSRGPRPRGGRGRGAGGPAGARPPGGGATRPGGPGGARPSTGGYRGPGGPNRGGPGARGGFGGRGNNGAHGSGPARAAGRGFGGGARLGATLERPVRRAALPPYMTVKELADELNVKPVEVIKEMMKHGVMATINQQIDYDTGAVVAVGLGFEVSEAIPEIEEDLGEVMVAQQEATDQSRIMPRPPVVTIMGHVDHGKTKLLDSIRKANVIATEAGGITQHIGAYQVELQGRKITFLDTPGHEAFTAMRARGAQATDIVILVVAADDGVMPQTVEALSHAKAAGVPIIVAINKIDKEDANPDRAMTQLSEHGLVPTQWGGDTEFIPVSARTGEGIPNLLETILLVAEIAEFKANPERRATGVIIEAEMDRNRGPIATVLIQNGTLNLRDYIVAGSTWGRVRAMQDDKGRKLRKAEPSMPAEILGLISVPMAGDTIITAPDETTAKQIAEQRARQKRLEEGAQGIKAISLEDLFSQVQAGRVKELRIILKADVQGSLEAITQTLNKLTNEAVKVNVLHRATGGITESDVSLAYASGAVIVGFNVRPDAAAKRAAEKSNIDIRFYDIIYNLSEDIEKAMRGLLDPTFRDVTDGYAEVRAVFRLPRNEQAAGLIVTEGKITRNSQVRMLRNGAVIYDGTVSSLKRFKDDVREVAQGYECGIGLNNFHDFQEGDTLEFYRKEQVRA
ncbi:MAG: translation initiation factor IF-2 [Chloroflexota bacterium]|nr:translation initiation factor IF-2 [Chloroflexota bacterium]